MRLEGMIGRRRRKNISIFLLNYKKAQLHDQRQEFENGKPCYRHCLYEKPAGPCSAGVYHHFRKHPELTGVQATINQ
jgi:hypothetical protein